MRVKKRLPSRAKKEVGIALLISIFILLLISVVAIALIVSSGTESALAGNYRSSTAVYYAALSGLEEVRSRLRANNPSSFTITNPTNFLPPPGTPLAVCSPVYLINPAGGEAVAPWSPGSTYADSEFAQEFASCGAPIPNPSPSALSVWNNGPLSTVNGNMTGPLYKWVRINGVSEKSLNNIDRFPFDGTVDVTPLYYNGTRLTDVSAGNQQVLEITALAVLPDGSQKLLQYLTTSVSSSNLLPAGSLPALTIAGSAANGVAFSPPTSNGSFYVSGVDLTTVPSCTAGAATTAIGVLNNSDITNVINGGNGGAGIPSGMQSKYAGSGPAANAVNVSSLFGSLETPSQFDALAQGILANADVVYPPGTPTYPLPTVSGSTLSAQTTGMSSTNPMTVVINGNLDLTSWHSTGYGLLLVTGNLNYDPDASWQGMIMVIGQGTITGSKSGSGEIDGAVLVANTRDASGNLLPDPNLGTASVQFAPNMGGNGIRYSHCLVQNSLPAPPSQILSFHEIPQ